MLLQLALNAFITNLLVLAVNGDPTGLRSEYM